MSVATDLVEELYPFIQTSPDYQDLAEAVGSMFAHVELYAVDQDDGTPGWWIVWDPVNCPTEALPYQAQVVGERLRAGMTDSQMREWIADRPNSKRGTPYGIALAAQRSLVGNRLVQLFERTMPDGSVDPNGDNMLLYTYEADTPDPAQVWQDLLTVLPAEMVCTYQVLAGVTWGEVAAGYATWADLLAANATWADVETTVVGGMTWSH